MYLSTLRGSYNFYDSPLNALNRLHSSMVSELIICLIIFIKI